jgi:hypothetical protein
MYVVLTEKELNALHEKKTNVHILTHALANLCFYVRYSGSYRSLA